MTGQGRNTQPAFMDNFNETLVQADRPLNGPSTTAIAAFLLLAVAGLEYVKWGPSLHRLQLIAGGGNMSRSALLGAGNADAVSIRAAWTYAWAYGRDIWKALVLGLILGSGVQAVVPRDWVGRLLGGKGYRGVSTATLIAMPSMMCTCCAAPVAVGLRRTGASTRATLAYWLANPLLNPATLILIGMILGWKWLALRSILGVLLIFACTFVAARWTELDTIPVSSSAPSNGRITSELGSDQSVWRRWLAGFFRLAASLIPEYLVLILLLGAVRAWLFPQPLQGHIVINGFWPDVDAGQRGHAFRHSHSRRDSNRTDHDGGGTRGRSDSGTSSHAADDKLAFSGYDG
jgi:uncharacterized membrane protein YraQ (UPF0718 family)